MQEVNLEDQKILIYSLIFLVLIMTLTLIGLVFYLVFLLKKKSEKATSPSIPELSEFEKIKEQLRTNSNSDDIEYCKNHPQDNSAGTCAICTEHFCEECLRDHEGLNFCKTHFRTYLENEWVEIASILTTPDTPEAALHVYDFKKSQWTESNCPTIVSTHYKINIESDYIESYVKLLVMKSDEEDLKQKLHMYQQ